MKFKVVKTFEGSLGEGPRTIQEGLVFEAEPVGEVTYWLAMGWVVPLPQEADPGVSDETPPESAAMEGAPEKAVKKAPRKRTVASKRSKK